MRTHGSGPPVEVSLLQALALLPQALGVAGRAYRSPNCPSGASDRFTRPHPPSPGAGHGLVAEPDRARWSAWLTELADEFADPHRLGARELVAGLLTQVLVAAARLAPAASPGVPDPLVERVFNQVEATFREPVSAGDVARALGYTPGHLTTVVRERTGRPLLEWITERRMTEVRRMLRETDLPLGVVAARTGLRDATCLVRCFRNRYGITPQRWRRTQHTWPWTMLTELHTP